MKSALGKTGTFTGSLLYAVELYDARTNELLARRCVGVRPIRSMCRRPFRRRIRSRRSPSSPTARASGWKNLTGRRRQRCLIQSIQERDYFGINIDFDAKLTYHLAESAFATLFS